MTSVDDDDSDRLTRAIGIALAAHARQVDKAGEPYILHPLRVMLAQAEPAARIVAILHDVAEDHAEGWSLIRAAGFGSEIIAGIDSVTRREGEDYFDFVRRSREDPIGRQVKAADLRDNLRGTHGNRERYEKALEILAGA